MEKNKPAVMAAIDVGSASIRLKIVQVEENGAVREPGKRCPFRIHWPGYVFKRENYSGDGGGGLPDLIRL